MSDCGICHVRKAEYIMKSRYGLVESTKTVVKMKICKKCFSVLNPEGKDRIEMDDPAWSKVEVKARHPDVDPKLIDEPMTVHFRRIRRR